ncbi:transposase, partial [Enterococcus cecorum]
LGHFHKKEYNKFFDILYNLPQNLDKKFKKSIKYLTKQTRNVKNALKLPYSNGKLEGKNNLIKVFQRVAFGFRKFENMRRRIFLYEENWQTKKPKKRECRRKTA